MKNKGECRQGVSSVLTGESTDLGELLPVPCGYVPGVTECIWACWQVDVIVSSLKVFWLKHLLAAAAADWWINIVTQGKVASTENMRNRSSPALLTEHCLAPIADTVCNSHSNLKVTLVRGSVVQITDPLRKKVHVSHYILSQFLWTRPMPRKEFSKQVSIWIWNVCLRLVEIASRDGH